MNEKTIFEKMLDNRRWLYRPWIPFLKSIEGNSFFKHKLKQPVLDLACGDGVFASAVYAATIDAGLDLDMESLKVVNGKYKTLCKGNASSLPFKNNSFQTIISACALEHIPGLKETLSEVYRVLKPKGRIIFSVPSAFFGEMLLTTKLLKLTGFNEKAQTYIKNKNAKSAHFHVYDTKIWEDILFTCNLKVLSYEYCLSGAAMMTWSLMTSSLFKLIMLPFRAVRQWNIQFVDNLLRSILISVFRDFTVRSGDKKITSGGYLIIVAERE